MSGEVAADPSRFPPIARHPFTQMLFPFARVGFTILLQPGIGVTPEPG